MGAIMKMLVLGVRLIFAPRFSVNFMGSKIYYAIVYIYIVALWVFDKIDLIQNPPPPLL